MDGLKRSEWGDLGFFCRSNCLHTVSSISRFTAYAGYSVYSSVVAVGFQLISRVKLPSGKLYVILQEMCT